MPGPTLGCQIAPNYAHEQWPYNSSSESDSDTEEEVVSALESGETQDALDIEKAETQRDIGPAMLPSRPGTLQRGRTKSSRREAQLEPVGFWHWHMVLLSVYLGLRPLTAA